VWDEWMQEVEEGEDMAEGCKNNDTRKNVMRQLQRCMMNGDYKTKELSNSGVILQTKN